MNQLCEVSFDQNETKCFEKIQEHDFGAEVVKWFETKKTLVNILATWSQKLPILVSNRT